MCKRLFVVFLILLLLLTVSLPAVAYGTSENISAKAAVVIVAGSNEVLYEKNSHTHLPMASTTKIMTSLLAVESGRLDEEICVTSEMITVEGTSMGLLPGDSVSLRELTYGMLLESGNDAANATAYYLSGSTEQFASLMNNKAAEIGMQDTHFVTPSGLDSSEHYSSAYDMALLGSYALMNSEFKSICSQYSVCVDYGNPPYKRYLTNHNKMLKTYDGAIGIKTGFTKKSGRCLVSAAERNGVTLICVTLNAPNDWNDHKILLDLGFGRLSAVNIDSINSFDIKVVGSEKKYVKAEMTGYPVAYSAINEIKTTKKTELQSFVYAPVKKGDILGYISYFYENGNLICKIPITASEDVSCSTLENSVNNKKSIIDIIKNFFNR